MGNTNDHCELCHNSGGVLLWNNDDCRVVRVDDPDYPGFCRIIWCDHVREMTDLTSIQRNSLMAVVFGVEHVIRQLFSPHKINLASFGNMTPHLHWHVIPRWTDDKHFPEPIWGNSHQTVPKVRSNISDETLSLELKQYFFCEATHG